MNPRYTFSMLIGFFQRPPCRPPGAANLSLSQSQLQTLPYRRYIGMDGPQRPLVLLNIGSQIERTTECGDHAACGAKEKTGVRNSVPLVDRTTRYSFHSVVSSNVSVQIGANSLIRRPQRMVSCMARGFAETCRVAERLINIVCIAFEHVSAMPAQTV